MKKLAKFEIIFEKVVVNKVVLRTIVLLSVDFIRKVVANLNKSAILRSKKRTHDVVAWLFRHWIHDDFEFAGLFIFGLDFDVFRNLHELFSFLVVKKRHHKIDKLRSSSSSTSGSPVV